MKQSYWLVIFWLWYTEVIFTLFGDVWRFKITVEWNAFVPCAKSNPVFWKDLCKVCLNIFQLLKIAKEICHFGKSRFPVVEAFQSIGPSVLKLSVLYSLSGAGHLFKLLVYLMCGDISVLTLKFFFFPVDIMCFGVIDFM